MATEKNIFKDYMNPIFFETGSYLGSSIQLALDSGYQKIYSIELSQHYYNLCKDKFKNFDNVNLILGDSCEKIFENIKDIDQNITFWLDGHYSCGNTALGKYWTPLMQELEQIKNHHIKTHTIIIDDMRCWKEVNPVHGFTTEDIIKKLYEINPDYKINYIDGTEKDDILVCKI